jgi:hypothetical protein
MSAPHWSRDPSRRHQWRYRDGAWTAWVADDGVVSSDADGLGAVRKARRRHWYAVALVVAVLAVPAVLFTVMVSSSEQQSREHAQSWIREMDSWSLPPSVQRSKRPDEVLAETFGASTESATRYYLPAPGTTTKQAAADLVTALRSQGYHDLDPFDGVSSFGSCPGEKYCDISIETLGRYIVVEFS